MALLHLLPVVSVKSEKKSKASLSEVSLHFCAASCMHVNEYKSLCTIGAICLSHIQLFLASTKESG